MYVSGLPHTLAPVHSARCVPIHPLHATHLSSGKARAVSGMVEEVEEEGEKMER